MNKHFDNWTPKPGGVVCYTGTRSGAMKRNHRVRILAEASGKKTIVQVLNAAGKGFGYIVVKSKNLAPIQTDLFVRTTTH